MWIRHFEREEKTNDERKNKLEVNQRRIFMNPERYGNNFNDVNSIKKDNLISSSVKNGYGNSLVNDMTGCPIQKVHKMKQKKRDKLKKYLYQGKEKNGYEYNKYKLQSGNGVSIDITPDYNFRRILDREKEKFNDAIVNQIKSNSIKRNFEKNLELETEKRDQKCYAVKMARLEDKQEKNKEALKKRFMNDINLQIKQKHIYNQRVI